MLISCWGQKWSSQGVKDSYWLPMDHGVVDVRERGPQAPSLKLKGSGKVKIPYNGARKFGTMWLEPRDTTDFHSTLKLQISILPGETCSARSAVWCQHCTVNVNYYMFWRVQRGPDSRDTVYNRNGTTSLIFVRRCLFWVMPGAHFKLRTMKHFKVMN